MIPHPTLLPIKVGKECTSRPAPSHSECYKKGYADAVANALSQHADCVKCLEEDRVTMLEHDAAIAAKAREDYDKKVSDLIDYLKRTSLTGFTKYTYRQYVLKQIQSLRSSTKEQPQYERGDLP